jgi:hypothetical protein
MLQVFSSPEPNEHHRAISFAAGLGYSFFLPGHTKSFLTWRTGAILGCVHDEP